MNMTGTRRAEKLEFAERLTQLVEKRGGAAAVVEAAYPAFSRRSLRGWMAGRYWPIPAKLRPLANALGVNIHYLVTGREPSIDAVAKSLILEARDKRRDAATKRSSDRSSPAARARGTSAAFSRRSLRAWLAGKHEPSPAKLAPLADALGVSIDYLVCGARAIRAFSI